MSILKRRGILKVAAIFMLVAMMTGAFAGYTKAAVAAGCPGLGSTPIVGDTSGDSGTHNCDIGVTITPNNVLNLTFASDSNVVADTDTTPGLHNFTFHVTVVDTRATIEGWRLQAASAGLLNTGHTTIALAIVGNATVSTGTDGVCTITPSSGDSCGTVTASDTSLVSGSSTPFLTDAAIGAAVISGTFNILVTGSYTIPAGAFGAYSGTITLSLVNASV
jgi:hypothetical protein